MPVGIFFLLVLLFLFVVLFIRAQRSAQVRQPAVEPEPRSPFDAGPLTQRQQRQDDWDQNKVVKSDRFWGDKQQVLVPVFLDYVSAKGERSEREVDIQAFQVSTSDHGDQTLLMQA